MKKLFFTLMTCVLALGIFVGCNDSGSSQSQSEARTIEEIKLTIDETKGAEFLENFNYVLHNVYADSTGHLIPDDKRNSDDLFKDEITKFKFIY